MRDYTDLTDFDMDVYECQNCGHLTGEKFDHGNCPNCSRPGVLRSTEWARSFNCVDHSPGFTGYATRTVRVDTDESNKL